MDADTDKFPQDKSELLDDLIRKLRPIENLFQLMQSIGAESAGLVSVQKCGEIGQALTDSFRSELDKIFRSSGGQ